MKKRVLMSAPYMMPVIEDFRGYFEARGVELVIPEVRERMEEAQLLALIADIDGVICGDDRFTPAVLAKAKRLKVISKWGTGIDSIDLEACRAHGVQVCNTPGAFTEPVADTVMAYILTFARGLLPMDRAMKQGRWHKITGHALHEVTLGVIGVGDIGTAVLRRARVFGMKLLGHDIRELDAALVAELGVEMVGFEELLARSDYISTNCDLNPTSVHLLNQQAFEKMARQPVVINCARGPIVHETALIEALELGRVRGAGMDVFEVEPLPMDSALMGMENVLLAPHNSNNSPAAYQRVHENTIRNLFNHIGETV